VVRMQKAIQDKLAAIPGVTSVAFTNEMPMETSGHDWDAVCTDNESLKGSEIPPLRIFERGREHATFFAMLEANVRVPRQVGRKINTAQAGVANPASLNSVRYTIPSAALGSNAH